MRRRTCCGACGPTPPGAAPPKRASGKKSRRRAHGSSRHSDSGGRQALLLGRPPPRRGPPTRPAPPRRPRPPLCDRWPPPPTAPLTRRRLRRPRRRRRTSRSSGRRSITTSCARSGRISSEGDDRMELTRLAKALIVNTETNQRTPVMYNPEELKLDQGNNFAEVGIPGLNAPPVQYVRGKARTLSMDLFFDTYEMGEDVRRHTGPIVRLLRKLPRTLAPPVLLFVMGQFTFQCVLVEAGQRFTMFFRDGTPVRSTMSVRFQEFVRVEVEVERGFFVGPPTLHN